MGSSSNSPPPKYRTQNGVIAVDFLYLVLDYPKLHFTKRMFYETDNGVPLRVASTTNTWATIHYLHINIEQGNFVVANVNPHDKDGLFHGLRLTVGA